MIRGELGSTQEMQHSYFVEVLPEGGIATLEARLRSRGAAVLPFRPSF